MENKISVIVNNDVNGMIMFHEIFNPLSGSEKQVKWANDIRKTFIIDMVETSKKLLGFKNDSRFESTAELITRLDEIVLDKKSSTWWIDGGNGRDFVLCLRDLRNNELK